MYQKYGLILKALINVTGIFALKIGKMLIQLIKLVYIKEFCVS